MLRRRTERKAKVAASSLFKRVASGQDWNPSSPGPCIPVKRSSSQSKAVVTNSARLVRSVTSSSKVAADSLKKESPRTQQKSGFSPKKGVVKVAQKSDNMSKKGTAKLPQKTGNSHKNDVEVAQKQTRCAKKVDTKTPVKLSASPKKEDAKDTQKLGNLPKRESVTVPVKLVVSPQKEDCLVPNKCNTPPKKEDGKLPQKLVASPKKADVEAVRKTAVTKPPDLEKKENLKCGSKLDKCVKIKAASQSKLERNGELKNDPKVVISSSVIKQEASPDKEAIETKTESGVVCQARKRKLDPELESQMIGVNEVCVKLTKLDEKAITSVDQSSERTEGQVTVQGVDSGTPLKGQSATPNTLTACKQTDRNTITYPSDRCCAVEFLAMIGLVPKSDVKKLEGSPNKLHREAGGKLRRILKPRLMPGMVYRKMTVAKGLSLTGIVMDHQSKPGIKPIKSVPAAMQNADRSKPKVSNFSAATKFTLLRKETPPLLASEKVSKTLAALKPEVGNVCSESRPEEPSVGVFADTEKTSEEVTALPDEKSTKEKKEEVLEDVTAFQDADTHKCIPKKKPELVKSCTVPKVTSDMEPVARRSARQQGNKRRVWGHLLRANPDEFEENCKWETGVKDPTRNLPKTCSLEDVAKKPADKTTNDDFTVIDVVSDAVTEQEKAAKEGTEGKPVHDSTTYETECSQEPDLNLPETSFASPVSKAPAETPCPSQSASDRKSSLNSKPVQLAGKKRKKVPKEATGKCSRASKTLTFANKIKVAKKIAAEKNVTKSRIEANFDSLDVLAFSNYSFLSYRNKETDCLTPHMCTVCWVNDHMYCRNMKRTTNDLPPFGGCIHYIPCVHYWPPNTSQVQRSPSDSHNPFHYRRMFIDSTCSAGDRSEGLSTVERCWNDEDLMCQEKMIDSDSESRSPIPPEGTEILGIQLKTRAQQIIRSLGIDRMPESLDLHGVSKRRFSMDSDKAEDDCSVAVEEYGAEVCVDHVEEADNVQELLLKVQRDSSPDQSFTCKSPSVEELDSSLAANGPSGKVSEVRLENRDTGPENMVFDVSKEFSLGHLSSNLCIIRVQVQKLDSDRVRVTYPKTLEGHEPGDDCGRCFVQKEVKFPTGADEKALNEFLAQEAVRLVNEAPLEVQRRASKGMMSPFNSGSFESKATKWNVATAACPANQAVPSVMGKSKKKRKGVEHASICTDQKPFVRKESVSEQARKRCRKVSYQSDIVLPTLLATTQSGIGSNGSTRSAAVVNEVDCLPNTAAGIGSSIVVTTKEEFSLPGKASQIAPKQVSSPVSILPKMEQSNLDVKWLCGGTEVTADDLEMLNSSLPSHSANSIIPYVGTSSITPSVVHLVDSSARGEIPNDITSRTITLVADDQDQSVSDDQDQVINADFDRGSSFAANDVQEILSNLSLGTVGCDQETSALSVISAAGSMSDILTGGGSVDSRPVPVYHGKDLGQSCIAQMLQCRNSASSLPIVNTLPSSKVTNVSPAPVPGKSLSPPLSGPQANLPCNSSYRPQTDDSSGSTSEIHSLFTGLLPGAITRPTGLVIPLGYSVPGQFVPVNARLPAQLTHLPLCTAACNTQHTKSNCVALANMALTHLTFSSAALTSIALESTSSANTALGCTTTANLASTNLSSANLDSTNTALKDVVFTNLASSNLASGNLSVNAPSGNVMASSVNVTLSNVASGNVACGNTIICMNPAEVGPTAMKITRLDRILAGNHGPLLIAQAGSGIPSAIFPLHPSHSETPQAQSCATTMQSPLLNASKCRFTSPLPLTLAGAPKRDILQMAWNQCNDDCSGSVSCESCSGVNVTCAVTSASNISPNFFTTVDSSNVV